MEAHLQQKARATAASCHRGILRGSWSNEYSVGRREFLGPSNLGGAPGRTAYVRAAILDPTINPRPEPCGQRTTSTGPTAALSRLRQCLGLMRLCDGFA